MTSACTWATTGRLAEAEREFREAVRLLPDDADALNNLGRAVELQGRREEAAALYQRALAVDPAHPLARENLEALEAAP